MRGRRALLDSPFIDFLLNYQEDEPFSQWVARMASHAKGRDLPEGWVRGSFLAIDVDGEVVGRISVRYELNDYLAAYEGHVGYAVLPEYRNQGYATEALRLALALLSEAGLDRVLITCDDDNTASSAVIEKVGGELEGTVVREDGAVKRRYWLSA